MVTEMNKEYFIKHGTNEENLFAYLYMEFNDYNELHMLHALQNYSGLPEEQLHDANVSTIKEIINRCSLDEFLDECREDFDFDYNYYPLDSKPFENSFIEAVADAVSADIKVSEEDIEPVDNDGLYEGAALYKGEKFYFSDHSASSTKSLAQGAAIDLLAKKVKQLESASTAKSISDICNYIRQNQSDMSEAKVDRFAFMDNACLSLTISASDERNSYNIEVEANCGSKAVKGYLHGINDISELEQALYGISNGTCQVTEKCSGKTVTCEGLAVRALQEKSKTEKNGSLER